jgi:aquaglyceroporin related protein
MSRASAVQLSTSGSIAASPSSPSRSKRSGCEFHENADDGTAVDSVDDEGEITLYPNRWARWRWWIREPAAEFLGTMLLVIFGTGVDCQVTLTGNTGVAASQKGVRVDIYQLS